MHYLPSLVHDMITCRRMGMAIAANVEIIQPQLLPPWLNYKRNTILKKLQQAKRQAAKSNRFITLNIQGCPH